MLEAVKKWEGAIEYASDELRNDREFMLEAIKIDRSTLNHASSELRSSMEFIQQVEGLKQDKANTLLTLQPACGSVEQVISNGDCKENTTRSSTQSTPNETTSQLTEQLIHLQDQIKQFIHSQHHTDNNHTDHLSTLISQRSTLHSSLQQHYHTELDTLKQSLHEENSRFESLRKQHEETVSSLQNAIDACDRKKKELEGMQSQYEMKNKTLELLMDLQEEIELCKLEVSSLKLKERKLKKLNGNSEEMIRHKEDVEKLLNERSELELQYETHWKTLQQLGKSFPEITLDLMHLLNDEEDNTESDDKSMKSEITRFSLENDLFMPMTSLVDSYHHVKMMSSSGWSSEVRQATKNHTKKQVILKCQTYCGERGGWVMEELSTMVELKDCHGVIHVQGLFMDKTNERVFIEIPCYSNGNLLDFVKEKQRYGMEKNELKETLKGIFRQVIKTLQHIHSMKVLHCNLKPQNILIQCDGDNDLCPILTDFGSNQLMEWMNKNRFGTMRYVMNKTHPHSEKSDVYSMGLIMFECWKLIEVGQLDDEELKELTVSSTLRDESDKLFIEMVSQVVVLNPCERPTSTQILTFDYFTT